MNCKLLPAQSVYGHGTAPGQFQCLCSRAVVQGSQGHLVLPATKEYQQPAFGAQVFDGTLLQGQPRAAESSQGAIVMQEHCVFTAPGKRAAVKGILAAFQAGLVTVNTVGEPGKAYSRVEASFSRRTARCRSA